MRLRSLLFVITLIGSLGASRAADALLSASAPQKIAGGTFEASAVVHVKGTNGVLFVDDGTTREVLWMEIGPDGQQRAPAVRIPLGLEVVDLEGMTTDGTHIYVVGSQSKNDGLDGPGLVRFTFDAERRAATGVESLLGLKAFLAANVRELEGTARRRGDHVLNIEAIAWDPDGERLLLGLRAPVPEGQALVVPLKLRKPAGPLSAENVSVDGQAIRVPLGGAGVRSLEYDHEVDAFRLIAAAAQNAETRDFRILDWAGPASPSTLKDITTFPRDQKPEGITRATLHGRSLSILVFDTGRFAILE